MNPRHADNATELASPLASSTPPTALDSEQSAVAGLSFEDTQRKFAAATGAPSPEQWSADKSAQREREAMLARQRARHAKLELLPAETVEAIDVWRDAGGCLVLAVQTACERFADDDQLFRDVCLELQSIADLRSNEP